MSKQSFSEQDSLQVIQEMIAKAKGSHHDNGSNSILWGVVITFCGLISWASAFFDFQLPFDVWLLALFAIVPSAIMSWRESRQQKVRSYDQTAMDYVWICFGVAMFLLLHASAAVAAQFGALKDSLEQLGSPRPDIRFREFSSAYLLTLYGIPTMVTAGIKGFRPMYIGAIVCWVSAVLVVYTPFHVDMLLMAISSAAAWLIPGLILRKKYKQNLKRAPHV